MATFADLAGELVGRLPGLSPFLAETFVQRAFRRICEERGWSFLITDGAVICPAAITVGTVGVTFGSPTVTTSAIASAALAAVTTPPGLTALQIRFFGIGSGGTSEIYNIIAAVGNPLTLTLDRPAMEATNALSTYLVYRVYVNQPLSDFLSWLSLVDMPNAITIARQRLSYTSTYFDCRDPQRQSLGLAYYLGYYSGSSQLSAVDSLPRWELWPGSTQGQIFYVRFRRRGTNTVLTDPVPSLLPDGLIVEYALVEHGYPHAQANIGHFPAMKGVNWADLKQTSLKAYNSRLNRAKITDNELAEQQVLNRGHGLKPGRYQDGYPFPIDANYLQSHLVSW